MKKWQKKILDIIKDSLKKGEFEDTTLVRLATAGFELSAYQYDFYRKKAMAGR